MPLVFFTFSGVPRLHSASTLDRYFPSLLATRGAELQGFLNVNAAGATGDHSTNPVAPFTYDTQPP
eukprot:406695-Pyramimonas_sp.AAC.1